MSSEYTSNELKRRSLEIDQLTNLLKDERDDNARFEIERAIEELLEDMAASMGEHPLAQEENFNTSAAPNGLAVVVGHKKNGQGVAGVAPPFPDSIGRYEYSWNTELAERIKAFADAQGIRCKIFFRDGKTFKQTYVPVKNWKPQATLELHLNSGGNDSTKGSLTLYGKSASKTWAQTLQDMMVDVFDRRGSNEDRGIHIPNPQAANGYKRGRASVTQIHPSALVEPFFSTSRADADWSIGRKQAYAEGVVKAFAAFTGRALTGGAQPQPAPPVAGGNISDVPLFRELVTTWQNFTPAVEGLSDDVVVSLKAVTLAQWIEETGWASSDLSQIHRNFAGMKANWKVEHVISGAPATAVRYEAHDGWDNYLRFNSIEDFIRGYFLFLDRPPYVGWREQANKSPNDFVRFLALKWAEKPGYAARVLTLVDKLVAAGIANADGTLSTAEAPGGDVQPGAGGEGTSRLDLATISAEGATNEFMTLVGAIGANSSELAPVQAGVVAQWALESNWGRSELALFHYNFVGLRWNDTIEAYATKVQHPTAPEKGDFGRFLSPTHFVDGYLAELDARKPGWRNHLGSSREFIEHIGDGWHAGNDGYVGSIANIIARVTSEASVGQLDGTGTSGPNIGSGGIVLRVERERQERRTGKGYDRTVGRYQLYVEGQPVPGISGSTYERQGPGNNSTSGVSNHDRIEAGTYRLATHRGSPWGAGRTSKYRTIGFTSSNADWAKSRPAIKVMDTNARTGILFHPANDYLSSVGCIHFSAPLGGGATANIDWHDSRQRTIDIIDHVKSVLGNRFPDENNERIPEFHLQIVGEPRRGESFPETELTTRREEARVELERVDPAALHPQELYANLASLLKAGATLGMVDPDEFTQRIEIPLGDIRAEDGRSLWSPWAAAWQESVLLPAGEGEERATVQAALSTIAKALISASVAPNDRGGISTPLADAAAANSVDAMEALIALGASVDLTGRDGATALQRAAEAGMLDAVAFLLEQGADAALEVVPEEFDNVAVSQVELIESLELPEQGLNARSLAQRAREGLGPQDPRIFDYEYVLEILWTHANR